jgi:hypothetical protein
VKQNKNTKTQGTKLFLLQLPVGLPKMTILETQQKLLGQSN